MKEDEVIHWKEQAFNTVSSDKRLEAARADLGPLAKPVAAEVEKICKSLENTTSAKRRYRDFIYASFLGWALESVLLNSGTVPKRTFGPGL